MIIASKGIVRMKGDKSQIMAEFVTIASTLLKDADMPKDMLRLAIDIAHVNNEAEKEKS